jgi:hypothetical protein
MKKIVYVLAILAAGSTAAVAKDVKQDKKATVPAVAAAQMSDAEMDKVTAGGYDVINWGHGQVYHSNVNYNGASHGFRGNNYHAAGTNF